MKKVLVIFLSLIVVAGISLVVLYNINTGPVSKTPEKVEFEVKQNDTFATLGASLLEAGLIKNETFYKLYIKINKPTGLEVGVYNLDKAMSLKDIIDVLKEGTNYNPDIVILTIKEGANMRDIASLIAEKTDNKEDDVYAALKDEAYLKGLIKDYWFLTDEILEKDIYYPLEGYIFPETFEVATKSSVADIFALYLNHTKKILDGYKAEIEASDYTIHQIMTLASIIELEAANSDDRAGVAGVFYNRLNDNWSLGSDVTTYYASKIDDFKIPLTYKELNDCSTKYNTRCTTFKGLPIGPISNPGKESIVASIIPKKNDYYYFVADCNKKTYFNYDASGHSKTIQMLKDENNWCA